MEESYIGENEETITRYIAEKEKNYFRLLFH